MKELIYKDDARRAALHNEGEAVVAAIDEIKPVEAVRVVRCGKCNWFERLEPGHPCGYCHAAKHGYHSSRWQIEVRRICRSDFFCADGEPRQPEE